MCISVFERLFADISEHAFAGLQKPAVSWPPKAGYCVHAFAGACASAFAGRCECVKLAVYADRGGAKLHPNRQPSDQPENSLTVTRFILSFVKTGLPHLCL
jgi:hypothetical protein